MLSMHVACIIIGGQQYGSAVTYPVQGYDPYITDPSINKTCLCCDVRCHVLAQEVNIRVRILSSFDLECG